MPGIEAGFPKVMIRVGRRYASGTILERGRKAETRYRAAAVDALNGRTVSVGVAMLVLSILHDLIIDLAEEGAWKGFPLSLVPNPDIEFSISLFWTPTVSAPF